MSVGTCGSEGARRLGRVERREQLLDAAARALVRCGGFASTGLDDVAAEAGVTRMILYRHFESRDALYRSAIDRAITRLHDATTLHGEVGEHTVPGMLAWAASDPDGFRLLFHHAIRGPEFHTEIDQLRASMGQVLAAQIAQEAVDPAWLAWATSLIVTTTIEAIMAWLDAGQPDPDRAAEFILTAVDGIFRAVDLE